MVQRLGDEGEVTRLIHLQDELNRQRSARLSHGRVAVPPPSRRQRVRRAVRRRTDLWRESVARRVAPWIVED